MCGAKLVAAAVALGLPAAARAAGSSWVYAGDGHTEANELAQARTWGGYCNSGNEQSPVDVETAKTFPATSLPTITTHFSTNLRYVKNTGHGFQLFETSPDSYSLGNSSGVSEIDALGEPKGYSMIGGQKYNFYQVHWHTPSENTVNGRSFPLEAHFVHQYKDPVLVGSYHKLAVIALLYELGECNEFLDQFWSQFPDMAGLAAYTGPEVDFNSKLNDELRFGYYHWYGSLTTPPCTEGVNWNLLHVYETVCQRQLDALIAALDTTQGGTGFNNRVVQPLNHRVIATSEWWAHSGGGNEGHAEESSADMTTILVMCVVIAILVFLLFPILGFIVLKLGEAGGKAGGAAEGAAAGPHAPGGADNTPLLSVQEMLATVRKEVQALGAQPAPRAACVADAEAQRPAGTPSCPPVVGSTIGKLAGIVCSGSAPR